MQNFLFVARLWYIMIHINNNHVAYYNRVQLFAQHIPNSIL